MYELRFIPRENLIIKNLEIGIGYMVIVFACAKDDVSKTFPKAKDDKKGLKDVKEKNLVI